MDTKIGNLDTSVSAMTSTIRPPQKKLDRIYDVFLSHRREDEALVTELYDYIENELHFEAYVDWKVDPELDRTHVNKDTANYLRTIMRHARSLIFVVGKNPGESHWTPWELGFFDGRQSAQRIRVYLPEGIELPAGQEYLGLYGRPLRKADLRRFLEGATLDVAAVDSAQSDQWGRHFHRALTRFDDYCLSVLQWQFGCAANLMTAGDQENLMPDEQPHDVPREPAALFGPWLQVLRQSQKAIRDIRRQLHAVHLKRRAGIGQPFPWLVPDWMKWLPLPTTTNSLPQSPGLVEGAQAAITQ